MITARRHAWRPRQQQDKGFVLIGLIALLTMGALYFFISNLTPAAIEKLRQAKTDTALQQAREALIGYALQYRDEEAGQGRLDRMYGYLPMPDLGNSRNTNVSCPGEGCDANTPTGITCDGNNIYPTIVGRLPWKTLGTGPLRDGHGECLWFIVSSLHLRKHCINPTLPPMNWDTLGQLDIVVANGTNVLASLQAVHDRPIAVIFSPGPPLPGQNRSVVGGDDVSQCGGNYDAANYLDPTVAAALGGVTNYLAGTNNASGVTGDSDTSNDPDDAQKKSLLSRGKVFKSGGNYLPDGCTGSDCDLLANDTGQTLTGEQLFRAIRQNKFFRTDINTMLDQMVSCLRDEVAAGGSLPSYGNIAGADTNSCYGAGVDPLGYYPHYKEMIFVAAPGSAAVTVDGVLQPSCAGALILAGQRDTQTLRCPVGSPTSVQKRSSGAERADRCNYLEDPNLTSFTGSGTTFSGQSQFERVTTTQTAHQDIVRCIPATKSFTEAPSALPAGSELSAYDAATRTLTLGRANIESDEGYSASKLFGCVWTPEVHATGSGVRGYFKFQISDTGWPGEGFTFAAIDGDRNGPTVCGASVQHMGYSGNNAFTPIIAHPKIGIEFDTRRSYEDGSPFGFSDPIGFDPGWLLASPISTSHLNNGRGDPDYAGGHMGIVYWGIETDIFSDRSCAFSTCPSPMFCKAVASRPAGYTGFFAAGNYCHLKPEEDDNVHGRIITLPASRPHPRNPFALPAVPASPAGVYKLDPSLGSVPHNLNHVRVEIDRTSNAGRDDHGKRVRVVATTNLSLSGLQTIDSISLAAGNRVLLVAQTDAKYNGVWIAAAGAWTRAATENEGLEFPVGSSWFVNEGNAYTGTLWRLQNTEAIVVGSSQINIARFRDPVRAVATGNLTLSGLQTVDGVSLAGGDRVLLTNQTTASENGVYHASGGAWTRAPLEGTAAGMKAGATWYVKEGGGAGRYWHTTTDAIPGGGSAIGISLVTSAANDIYFSTMKTQVWKLPDSPTSANQIAKMKLTSRQLSVLDPTHLPLLSDTATVYDLKGASCNSSLVCASGEFCGIDTNCYSPAFRTMRLGFTNSQSTRDQVIYITDFATTWLP